MQATVDKVSAPISESRTKEEKLTASDRKGLCFSYKVDYNTGINCSGSLSKDQQHRRGAQSCRSKGVTLDRLKGGLALHK